MAQTLMRSQDSFGNTCGSGGKADISRICRGWLLDGTSILAFRVFPEKRLSVVRHYRSALTIDRETVDIATFKDPFVLLSHAPGIKNVLHLCEFQHSALSCGGKFSVERQQHAATEARCQYGCYQSKAFLATHRHGLTRLEAETEQRKRNVVRAGR